MALAERELSISSSPALAEDVLGAPCPFHFTRAQYYQMGEMGWFEGRRVERIQGEVREMSPISSRHLTAVMLATRALGKVFDDGYALSVQNSFRLGAHSDPEPDIAVLPGDIRSFREQVPSVAVLVVEVSASTLAYDQTRKAALYAQAGIEDYWIVNLNAEQVEVYREPGLQEGNVYGYAAVGLYKSGQMLVPLAAPDTSVAVADLLP